jgi:hypothetical protein
MQGENYTRVIQEWCATTGKDGKFLAITSVPLAVARTSPAKL